jgi:transposase-like protein
VDERVLMRRAETIWLRVSRIRKGVFVPESKAGAGP